MNERIKELAEQAGYSKDFLSIGIPNNMEKFAELIIKECADLYENESDNWFGTDTKFVLKLYSKKLKEHFGVEE
jgi:hypothetical protein